MEIDINSYAIPDENYNKVKIAKTQILIASSLRLGSNHLIRLKHKDFGKTKSWPTYTITREGIVYEHYKPINHSEFLGIKEADIKTISIVLENMGSLMVTHDDLYVNWVNEVCDEINVEKKKHIGIDYWEKYSEEQLKSLVELCVKLCDDFNIPRECIDFNHYNRDIIKYRGIAFRSNYIDNTMDVNPLFNISKFNEMLQS
jgi:hypothetical protein